MITATRATEREAGAAAPSAKGLGERLMGFLALIALALALGPLVFDLASPVDRILEVVEWTIVAVFALDFVMRYRAPEGRAWRIIDVVTIVGPFLALLPGISEVASGSLALRLLRVFRAVAYGTRAGGAATRTPHDATPLPVSRPPEIVRVYDDGRTPTPADWNWEACPTWISDTQAVWYHGKKVTEDYFAKLAKAANLATETVATDYKLNSPARVRCAANGDCVAMFLCLATVGKNTEPRVTRERLAVLLTTRGVLTATSDESVNLPKDFFDLADRARLSNHPLPIRVALGLLALARDRFLHIAHRYEAHVQGWRPAEIAEGGRQFLENTYELRRQMTSTALDVRHLNAIVASLAGGRACLLGADLSSDAFLRNLVADVTMLEARLDGLKEDVQSMIELHVNIKSFEMSKLLKLLAIVSLLGLIPAIVGGMLGMNVAGNPWPITLAQVAFGVTMSAATVLYLFGIKGWLR